MCVAGARWVQRDLLDEIDDPELRVYAVWFDMYPGDARDRWPENLLHDPRVVHLWDDGKVLGRWYGRRLAGANVIYWDAFLLYDRDSEWADAASHPISRGNPIIHERSRLERSIRTILGQRDAP